jgi:hypothetical protein
MALLDDCRDGPVLEEAIPAQHRSDECLPALAASDAWDGAHQDAVVDAALLHPVLAGAAVERLVDPVQDVRAQDAQYQPQEY